MATLLRGFARLDMAMHIAGEISEGRPRAQAARILLLLAVATRLVAQAPPDLVLYNAKVFTATGAAPEAQAIAIRGERIMAVGTTRAMRALAGPATRLQDLHGRRVVPGINDAHFHLFVQPPAAVLHFRSDEPSVAEVRRQLAGATRSAASGSLIIGDIGVAVTEDTSVTRELLDRLAPRHAVILRGTSGHFYVLNSRAMRRLHIAAEEPDPLGGHFERVAGTRIVNGRATEFAAFMLHRRISELATDAQALNTTRAYLRDAVRFGITSVQTMTIPVAPARLVRLYQTAPTRIRVRVMRYLLTDTVARLTGEDSGAVRRPSPLITFSGTKWDLDGTPVERWAAMRAPYADAPATAGAPNFSGVEMQAMLRESLATNDQLLVHAIGDRTAELFLDAMDATGGATTWAARRVRMEHGCGLTPELMARARQLGVVVVVDPGHFVLGEVFIARWGAARLATFEPLRSLLQVGIPVALASDGLLNPWANVMLASSHPARPSEAISRAEALIAYTRTAAYAEFMEGEKGTIAPGMLADLAVLSQDVLTVPSDVLPATTSVLTIVGGKIVYRSR